jgi:hypothetical protein
VFFWEGPAISFMGVYRVVSFRQKGTGLAKGSKNEVREQREGLRMRGGQIAINNRFCYFSSYF